MTLLRFIVRYLAAAWTAVVTLSFGVFSARRRYLITQWARAAGYNDTPLALPTIAIAECTSDATSVVLPSPEFAEGNVATLELVVLARFARERRPKAIFEIGTFNGRTTLALAANAPESTVFTLDLPRDHATQLPVAPGERAFVDKPRSGDLFQGSSAAPRIRQLYGDSATFDLAPYTVDMVFIDGSHAYEYVLSDSRRAFGLLRGGAGLLVWHDYGEWRGVTRALNELREADPRFAGLRWIAGTSLAVLGVPSLDHDRPGRG